MKTYFISALLLISLSATSLAHKKFWEIKATALPDEQSLSLSIFFSLEQLKATYPKSLKINSYSIGQKEEITEVITKLAPGFITFKDGKKALTPFVRSINIITNSFDEAEINQFTIPQVDIEVELVYPLDITKDKFEIEWHVFADELMKAKKIASVEVPKDALNVSVYFLDNRLSRFTVNPTNKSFVWERRKPNIQNELRILNKEYEIKTRRSELAYYALVIFLLAVICWSLSLKKFMNRVSYLLLIASVISLCLSFTYKTSIGNIPELPKSENLKQFMEIMLSQVYQSVNRSEWEGLDTILSSDFKQKLIIDNFKTINKNILNHVETIEIQNLEYISNNSIQMNWYVKTIFQHISHIHEKDLKYSGSFSFSEENSKWVLSHAKIRQVF